MARGRRKAGGYDAEAAIVSAGARSQSNGSLIYAASKRIKDTHLDGEGESDGSQGMFVKQPTPSNRRQRTARNHQTRATGGSRPSDSVEDISHKEVRQSLVSLERGKPKNKVQLSKGIKAFKKHTEAVQKDLEALTARTTHSLSFKLTSSNDLFKTAYISSLPNNASPVNSAECLPGFVDPYSNPMYIHCKKLLSEAIGLLAGHKNIETELQALRNDILPALDTKNTFEKALHLLHTGHQVGLCKIEGGVLGASSTGDGTILNLDSSLYAAGDGAAGIWGKIVRKQEKAVKKSAKVIEEQ